MAGFDWVVVQDRSGRDIGVVGFIGDDAVAIGAFFDGRDADKDGRVSVTERVVAAVAPFGLDGSAIAEVAMQGRHNPLIVERDPSFHRMSANIFAGFAANMAVDAVWSVYFKRGVRAAGTGVAKVVTDNMVKQMVIRKGFERVAREGFDRATAL
ncbi:hypothetical protein [Paracoccus alkenifer]|uniref:Uncharacterized protein n=1 Tax=Paracoccus alkenifer TaxID=65735 RepID=A0A1H6JC04_9RHOB|nr:hypothetical protein [Paracoccus alkenifer]SEH58262.1 hypothetical protein SAMN04488075_0194 [Paracoccus alkenifer]